MLDLIKAVGIVFALSFISSSFSTFVIRERKCGFMAMQLLAGQNRVVYWGMSYLWDFLSIIIPITIIVIVFIIFNEQAYIGKDHVGAFIVLMLTYGLAITPLMYCFTFAFRVPSVAFVTLLAINIIVATVTAVIFYTLDLISYENPNIKPVVQVLEKVFLIFPQFAFCRGFYELAKRHTLNQQGLQQLVGAYGIFGWGVMTAKLVALLIEAVVFSGLVLLISYTSGANTCEKCKKRRWKKAELAMAGTLGGDSKPVVSEDVMEEIGRVENFLYHGSSLDRCDSTWSKSTKLDPPGQQ
ncbi:ATP-binding cassette sub-family A member [Echinococcus granulosus]|uniref:ATP-binding cassette sub-family A member n=1 Tax=Echinococcus granulosus TaxID=6210 RepID=W6UWI2_ECHGR|nr:ATP-binding cassette sub-family A member [Echinococcus granulosus]EUB57844.1 ATP-binding cassette sub-family A member [Echinococcus granulosus]